MERWQCVWYRKNWNWWSGYGDQIVLQNEIAHLSLHARVINDSPTARLKGLRRAIYSPPIFFKRPGLHTDASNRGTISDNFLAKRGWVIRLIRWQIQKRGVIWHETAQNPGNFNTFLISLENFDRKSNIHSGSLGVKSCKKGRHSVKKKKKKKKKRCRKGGLLSGRWHIPANGSVPPPSSWLMKFIPILIIPLSQLVISCEFKCSIP